MAVGDFIAFGSQNSNASPEPIDELLMRLRQVRRRLERWIPSADSIALWSNDYTEIFGAAQRLEATVGELDSGLNVCNDDLDGTTLCLRTMLDKLERSTSEFEDSILRNTAVA